MLVGRTGHTPFPELEGRLSAGPDGNSQQWRAEAKVKPEIWYQSQVAWGLGIEHCDIKCHVIVADGLDCYPGFNASILCIIFILYVLE